MIIEWFYEPEKNSQDKSFVFSTDGELPRIGEIVYLRTGLGLTREKYVIKTAYHTIYLPFPDSATRSGEVVLDKVQS